MDKKMVALCFVALFATIALTSGDLGWMVIGGLFSFFYALNTVHQLTLRHG